MGTETRLVQELCEACYVEGIMQVFIIDGAGYGFLFLFVTPYFKAFCLANHIFDGNHPMNPDVSLCTRNCH